MADWAVVVPAVAGASVATGGALIADRASTKYKRRQEDRAQLRELQSLYKGRILESALDWDRRMMQLYEGAYKWLDPDDTKRVDPKEYYFQSVVFRFLQLMAIARRFEAEALYIDSDVAKPRDFDLLRYAKTFLWVMIHAELTPDDGQPGRDHLRSDALRPMLDLCYSTSPVDAHPFPETRSKDGELIFDLERYLAMLKLAAKLEEESDEDLSDREVTYRNYVRELLEIFDGVRPDDYEENRRLRRRWDRLVALHLLTLAFINTFNHDSNSKDLASRTDTAVTMLLYPGEVQHEFDVWLPRLGLARARELQRVRATLARVVSKRGEDLERGEDRAKRVYDAIRDNRRRRPLPDGPDLLRRPRTTWGEADYAPIGDQLREVAEAAVDRVRVGADDRVLDLACGTGTAALLAAQHGARTVAVDCEPRMLELAQHRDRERLVEWRLGDVANLPIDKADKFSVVLSVFGVMYAHNQKAVVCQLAEHCMNGARIAMTAWSPGSFMPELGHLFASFLPPAREGFSSSEWGDTATLGALLEQHGIQVVKMDQRAVVLVYSDPETATNCFLDSMGHVVRERPRLKREGQWSVLRSNVRAFVEERMDSKQDRVRLSLDYLLALGEYVGPMPPERTHESG